jgi:hypothetical protein
MIEMPCSDIRIRGKSVHVNDISRQQFSKIASRRFQRRMTLTGQGLVLGAGTLLAKLDDKALPIEADQVRIWTLLTIAYGHDVALAILGSLRRVAKRWQGGDKSLAAIHLAQMGLPDIGEDAAFRMALAAELLDAGVAPRELGLNPVQFDVSKYDENQLRVPAGSGRESGQWTSGDAATAGDASSLVEGRRQAPMAEFIKNIPCPRMPSLSPGRMDQQSTARIRQPRSSWPLHSQIFRRSMQLANGSQICRFCNKLTRREPPSTIRNL